MRFLGVIPARYTATRLPGKALLPLAGKPLIQWVYERSREAGLLDDLVVATDDDRIVRCVESFGGRALMTRSDHRSGTDRVAEVASLVPADFYINIQGDEPQISPSTIDAVCRAFEEDPEVPVTSARVPLADEEEIESPHNVKVVVDHRGRALYFSRGRIPFPRRPPWFCFKHLGIYGYRRDFLLNLDRLRPSRLEEVEGLEQLRFLENGFPIRVVEVTHDSIGVDTAEDLERVRGILENTPVVRKNQPQGT